MDYKECCSSLSLQDRVGNHPQHGQILYADSILLTSSPATPVYSADVTSWIGERRYTTAQNNIALGFLEHFDSPDGRVVLLVALYYVTSQRDRFTVANLNEEIIEEMDSWGEESQLSENVRFAVLLYASAVWLATTWLLDDVEGEKCYW